MIIAYKYASCWYSFETRYRGVLIHQGYQGYTKKEARKKFTQYTKEKKYLIDMGFLR